MKYVVILSVGPVQSMIAAARRSRDLWAGSWLLSELAKAVAKDLHQNGAELIFPFVANSNDLQPDSKFSVGNKIQVVIKTETQEQMLEIANRAKKAAQTRFSKIAQKCLAEVKHDLRSDIWAKQENDYVEVQYAWACVQNDDYLAASNTAAQLLAARKATRDFQPSALTACEQPYFALPKSSLDGARETVLPEKVAEKLRRQLHLSDSEQLDCLGVVKRLCGHPEQFTPITRVAAHDWIEKVKGHRDFQSIKEAYEALPPLNLATGVKFNTYADFPYDAQFLYPSRLKAELIQANEDEKRALEKLQKALKTVWKDQNEPCSYFVMLLADGDRMGQLLDQATNEQNHQDITKALSEFAGSVPDMMGQHKGQCIYAGGDDVLGLVPLSSAIDCAKELQDTFLKKLQPIAEELGAEHHPTLSVGLAICHIHTPLGTVRALAKRAEKIAKGDHTRKPRNALGITLAVRSGAISDMRLRWDDKEALEMFHDWIDAYKNNQLSSRVAYDCRDIFIRTDFPPHVHQDTHLLNQIRAAEFRRMLLKAQDAKGKPLKDNKELIEKLENRLKSIGNADDCTQQPEAQHHATDLDKLATELIIARWLAAKTQGDIGKENG